MFGEDESDLPTGWFTYSKLWRCMPMAWHAPGASAAGALSEARTQCNEAGTSQIGSKCMEPFVGMLVKDGTLTYSDKSMMRVKQAVSSRVAVQLRAGLENGTTSWLIGHLDRSRGGQPPPLQFSFVFDLIKSRQF